MLHLSSSLINGGTRFPINCVAITRLSFLQVCQTLPSPPTESSERSGVHYPEFHAANHPFCLSSLSPLLILCFSAPLSFTFAKSTTACCTVKLNISTGVIIFFFNRTCIVFLMGFFFWGDLFICCQTTSYLRLPSGHMNKGVTVIFLKMEW